MEIKCWFIGFICVVLFSCKAKKLVFKTKVELDEYLEYYGVLIFQNQTSDTLKIPESITFLPKDNDDTDNSIEIFIKNKKKLDTLHSKVFSITPRIYFDSEIGYLPRSINLNPEESYQYGFEISSFYNFTKDGNYVYKICFLTNLQTMQDTCLTNKFRYIHKK